MKKDENKKEEIKEEEAKPEIKNNAVDNYEKKKNSVRIY